MLNKHIFKNILFVMNTHIFLTSIIMVLEILIIDACLSMTKLI